MTERELAVFGDLAKAMAAHVWNVRGCPADDSWRRDVRLSAPLALLREYGIEVALPVSNTRSDRA